MAEIRRDKAVMQGYWEGGLLVGGYIWSGECKTETLAGVGLDAAI